MSRTLRVAAEARRVEALLHWTPDPNTIHPDDIVDRPIDAAEPPRPIAAVAEESPATNRRRGDPTHGNKP